MTDPEKPTIVLFSFGFRPFFLLAALWSAGAIGVWLWLLHSGGQLPSRFDAMTWHIHEMIFGFVMAVGAWKAAEEASLEFVAIAGASAGAIHSWP